MSDQTRLQHDLRHVADWEVIQAVCAWNAAREAQAMSGEVLRLAIEAGDTELGDLAGVVAHVASVAEGLARRRASAAVRCYPSYAATSGTAGEVVQSGRA